MKIQNPKLAGQTMTLRFSSTNGERNEVTGDSHGVFDMPEKDATHLLGTPGWKPVRASAVLDEEVEEAAPAPSGRIAPKPALKPPAPSGPARIAPKASTKPAPAAPAETVAVDAKAEAEAASALEAEIDALKTKADAQAFAELHGIEGLSDDMLLREMKEKLTKEMFEVDGDAETPDEKSAS